MAKVNGFRADLRTMSREGRQIAFWKGMVAYIPANRETILNGPASIPAINPGQIFSNGSDTYTPAHNGSEAFFLLPVSKRLYILLRLDLTWGNFGSVLRGALSTKESGVVIYNPEARWKPLIPGRRFSRLWHGLMRSIPAARVGVWLAVLVKQVLARG